MSQISIIVEFQLKPGQQEAFEEAIRAHARASKEQEPGCLRFDVIRPVEKDGTPINDCVWLAELYKDREAVAAHEASPRMPILAEKIGPMVVSRRLTYGAVVAD
ncbi:MAG: antibiotic biosynthesis monooxygenase [Cyanobacteria bacterium SZAS LIN-2]|nr:antibiotic biosynthesis monooxygenase [Cyanobacteria bacterium SZAS LIN-3]MBS1995929.1 antibiotic biosynthesis monooxygenase [Cyanobacteria bacterium SZAS LIN-2]MBS2008942.1 antibiotic biosynthesis monooxygenase [Cyanobacteria bacterium SZAS TMP-1]